MDGFQLQPDDVFRLPSFKRNQEDQAKRLEREMNCEGAQTLDADDHRD